MATEARDPTGPGGTTSGGTRAGDRASRAGGRSEGGRGAQIGGNAPRRSNVAPKAAKPTGPRDPTGPGGTISGGTIAGDRAAQTSQRGGFWEAIKNVLNPTQPTPITGNPIVDAIVGQLPVIGAGMKLTGFLQDLGVPSAPPSSGAAYQDAQARQFSGIGQQGQNLLTAPNPVLPLSTTPRPVAPPSVVSPPSVQVTTRGGGNPLLEALARMASNARLG